MIGSINNTQSILKKCIFESFDGLVLLLSVAGLRVFTLRHSQSEIFAFVLQLKLKWNCLSWKKKKRWMVCHLMAKRVPLLTADLTGPWATALTTTPLCSPSTTSHETTWRPLSVILKIWRTDSKSSSQKKTLFQITRHPQSEWNIQCQHASGHQ